MKLEYTEFYNDIETKNYKSLIKIVLEIGYCNFFQDWKN